MTFQEIIARANAASEANQFHVFQQYADGKRGYSTSRATLMRARSIARKLPGAIIYDRNGKARLFFVKEG